VLELRRFVRFSIVGTFGFLVDSLVLLALLAWSPLGLYSARVLSFLAAATATWLANRRWTFVPPRQAPSLGEWQRYVLVVIAGALVNYGTYAWLVTVSTTVQSVPILGVAAGSVAGMLINYLLLRRLVYRTASDAGRSGSGAMR
jgi:putative flippase GtrA